MRIPPPPSPAPFAPVPDGGPGARRWVLLAVVALTLGALALRWPGLDSRTPHAREADAAIVHYAAFYDRPAGAAMSDAVYPSTVYPVFLGRVLSNLPGSGYPIAAAVDAPLAAHLEAAAEPYLRGRRMIALLALLAIPFTFLFARRWLEPWWAVFAAALVATSMLAFQMGVVAKPHGALVGFSALALWSMLRLLGSGRARDYVLAGAATGCALAMLNSGCFLFPSFVLAHWLGWRSDRDPRRWLWFAASVAGCAVLFFSSYWFLFWPPAGTVKVEGALNFGQQAIDWDSWGYQGFLDMIPRTRENDPALVVVAGLGLCVIAWTALRARAQRFELPSGPEQRRLRDANLVVGLFVLIFVGLFGLHARYCGRYTLPMLPVLALVGAIGVRGAARALSVVIAHPRARAATGILLAVLALAFPIRAMTHLALLSARDDTATLAARWVEEHWTADEGTIALDVTLTLPLFGRRSALEELPAWALQPWTRYQLEVMQPGDGERGFDLRPLYEPRMFRDRRFDGAEIRERLAAISPRWAIVSVRSGSDAGVDETRDTVRALGGEPIATFLPYGPGGSLDSIITLESDPLFLEHLLSQERLGPPIEIYALR